LSFITKRGSEVIKNRILFYKSIPVHYRICTSAYPRLLAHITSHYTSDDIPATQKSQ